MTTGYRELLRARHAVRLLTATLAGRLPNATAALAVVLFARAHGCDYTLAGALSAVYGFGTAVGQPALGRLVDRRGQPRVMLGGALLSAAAMSAFALAGPRPLGLSCTLVAVAGVATPPLEGGLRALWPSVLGRRPGEPDDTPAHERVQAAYAMDAAAQEVMFCVGPLLVTLLVAAASTAAAILVLAAVGVAGALGVVTSPPSRHWQATERAVHWLGPLRSPVIRTLLCSFFFVGAALGAIAVAAVAYAAGHGGGMVSSYLLSALGLGALTGGVAYGARRWAGPPERRLRTLLVCLALGYLPLAATPGVAAMTALAALAGFFLAPTLACAFVVVDRYAPAGTVTEAFSWIVTAFGVGSAAGTALAGPVTQYGGVTAGFAVTGVGGVAAVLVLVAAGWFPETPNLRQRKENDRIGAAEPGFSGTDRA